jgi:hypothetical protein
VCSNPLPELYSWQLDAFFNAVENWKSKWTCVYSSTLCLLQTTETMAETSLESHVRLIKWTRVYFFILHIFSTRMSKGRGFLLTCRGPDKSRRLVISRLSLSSALALQPPRVLTLTM